MEKNSSFHIANYLALDILENMDIYSPTQLQIDYVEHAVDEIVELIKDDQLLLQRLLTKQNCLSEVIMRYFTLEQKHCS